MSALFDSDQYLEPGIKPVSPRKPRPMRVTVSDGRWVMVTRYNDKPHGYAHLVDGDANIYGGIVTFCGLHGYPLQLEAGMDIHPCSTCERHRQ